MVNRINQYTLLPDFVFTHDREVQAFIHLKHLHAIIEKV